MVCLIPGSVANPNGPGTVVVPCGKCPACRDRRINSWIFRLEQEQKIHTHTVFATLTYSDQEVPHRGDYQSLHKPDFQSFMRRLRKQTGTKTIKYYACGEYGEHTLRPHYHAVIFDVTPPQVVKAWTAGHARVEYPRSSGAMGYVAKYMGKPGKVGRADWDPRLREFSLMSKGLGLNYLTPAVVDYHRKGQISFVTKNGGAKHALPRIYRDRIFTKGELAWINYENQKDAQIRLDNSIRDAGGPDNYYRNRHAAIVAAMEKHHNQSPEGRNKI